MASGLDIFRRAAGVMAPGRMRRSLHARRRAIEASAVSLAFMAGLVMVAVGVALMHLPSGLIVGGVELAAGASLYARSGG